MTPNPALQQSVNSRLRRPLPPAELWRSAASEGTACLISRQD